MNKPCKLNQTYKLNQVTKCVYKTEQGIAECDKNIETLKENLAIEVSMLNEMIDNFCSRDELSRRLNKISEISNNIYTQTEARNKLLTTSFLEIAERHSGYRDTTGRIR